MFRSSLRCSPRVANSLRHITLSTGRSTGGGRRFASTSRADKKRSWKSSAARWGLAAGAVYWYSTSAVFAEEPLPKTIPPPPQFSDEDLPTVEAVVAQKRREAEARHQRALLAPEPPSATLASEISPSAPAKDIDTSTQFAPPDRSPEALEEEANQQGAFNPETGEINWDCPCLGGMAHGPCGEEFRAAFSCFVYSKEEPKGMDCIDKFQHMQDCFRLHPEVYGEELDDDEASEETTKETAMTKKTVETTNPEAASTLKSIAAGDLPRESKEADAEAAEEIKKSEKQNALPTQP
ncbi:Oxidoreductase [Parahypoxylon ruwenzoriense]